MVNQARGGVVPAVFGGRAQAEAAIQDMRQLGLTDREIGVAIADPIFHRLTAAVVGDADIVGEEELNGVAAGFILGAPIGSLAGIALMALAGRWAGPPRPWRHPARRGGWRNLGHGARLRGRPHREDPQRGRARTLVKDTAKP